MKNIPVKVVAVILGMFLFYQWLFVNVGLYQTAATIVAFAALKYLWQR